MLLFIVVVLLLITLAFILEGFMAEGEKILTGKLILRSIYANFDVLQFLCKIK